MASRWIESSIHFSSAHKEHVDSDSDSMIIMAAVVTLLSHWGGGGILVSVLYHNSGISLHLQLGVSQHLCRGICTCIHLPNTCRKTVGCRTVCTDKEADFVVLLSVIMKTLFTALLTWDTLSCQTGRNGEHCNHMCGPKWPSQKSEELWRAQVKSSQYVFFQLFFHCYWSEYPFSLII